MEAAKGTVEKVFRNKAGYYNANVDGEWYGTGAKNPPSFDEGDYIEFTFTRNGKFMNMDPSSVQKKEASVSSGAKVSSFAKKSAGGKDDYWAKKEERDANVQASINWQSSRNAAIAAVGAMIQNDVVSMPSAKAKRYDVFMALVDEVTTRYFHDTQHVFDNQTPPDGTPVIEEESEEDES